MPSFRIISRVILNKKILKGFHHIWAWRPSLSCDLDQTFVPLIQVFPIGYWALAGQEEALEKKTFEYGDHVMMSSSGSNQKDAKICCVSNIQMLDYKQRKSMVGIILKQIFAKNVIIKSNRHCTLTYCNNSLLRCL